MALYTHINMYWTFSYVDCRKVAVCSLSLVPPSPQAPTRVLSWTGPILLDVIVPTLPFGPSYDETNLMYIF